MTKPLILGAVGGLIVGAAVALYVPGMSRPEVTSDPGVVDSEPLSLESPVRASATNTAGTGSGVNTSGIFADRLARYAGISAIADSDVLVSMARSALNEPVSHATMTQLETLLARLFELDPEAAFSLVQTASLPAPVRSSAYRLWVELDSDAAIGLIDRIAGMSEQRRLALAIIDFLGLDAINRIVEVAPALGPNELAVAALAQWAEKDPLRALQNVSSLASRQAEELAYAEIGRIAGDLDAEVALSASDLITDAWFKPVYLEALYTEWSLNDLPGFFEYLETVDPRREVSSSERRFRGEMERFEPALANAAASDPERLLEYGREAGGELGVMAEAAALAVLAAQDPTDAIDYFDALPSGYRRMELAVAVASGYARHDFEAALSWATQMKPYLPGVKDAAMQVLAETDLAQAIRIEAENPTTMVGRIINAAPVPPWFRNRMLSDVDDPAFIADQIVAADAPDHWQAALLPVALSRWAIDDPNGAQAWMQSHGGDVTAGVVEAVAAVALPQADRLDIDRLIRFGAMLSGPDRVDWLAGAVGNVAAVSPGLALSVAERFRDEESNARFGLDAYETILTSAIRGIVRSAGPEAAVRMIDPSPPPAAAMTIGGTWAESDPLRAAQWAAAIPDSQARASAVASVARRWAQDDVDAAIGWAQGLSDRALADRAMSGICQLQPEASVCD